MRIHILLTWNPPFDGQNTDTSHPVIRLFSLLIPAGIFVFAISDSPCGRNVASPAIVRSAGAEGGDFTATLVLPLPVPLM